MKEESKRINEWFNNKIMLEGNRKYISIPSLLLDNFEELNIDRSLFNYICLIISNQKGYFMKREEVARKLKTTERNVSNWNKVLIKLEYLEITEYRFRDENTGRFSTSKVKYDLSGLERKLTTLLKNNTSEKNEPVLGKPIPVPEQSDTSRIKETLKLSDSSSLTERTYEINSERNFTKSSYPTDTKEKVYLEDTISLVNNFHQELEENDMEVSTDYYNNDFQFVEENPQYKKYIPYLVDCILSFSDLPTDYQNNILFLFNSNRKGRTISFCENKEFFDTVDFGEEMMEEFASKTISPSAEQETPIQEILEKGNKSFKESEEIDMDAVNEILGDFL